MDMNMILIVAGVFVVLFIYTLGYFAGKNKANKQFIKMLIKYKSRVPKDLELGNKK